MAQQKQRKQPILIDGNNIFTYCFQPIQRLQPDFTTNGIRNFMAKQKQRKQPILIAGKYIFTYYFQSVQRLQPNSKTYAIRKFHVYQAQRRQTKIKDILFYTATATYTTQFYESYILHSKPNKHNPNNQNINVGFTTNANFVFLQLRKRKFWSIHNHISTNFKKFIFNHFRTFLPSPICTFQQSRKTCTWLDEQFRTFHPSLHESVTIFRQIHKVTFLITLMEQYYPTFGHISVDSGIFKILALPFQIM